ncbi:MAG TPA: PEP/pyruvate-binding domain-containing protein [Anaerolineae bacterium]|nr:PEP/pyruvate-binding domain-containing protein [Anaerolineae bacterium]
MRRLLSIFKKIKFKKVDIPKASPPDKMSFKERYDCFQKLLADNNSILETQADMEEKLSGDYIFDMHYVNSRCDILVEKVQSVIENLNSLSNGEYRGLYDAFEKINAVIKDTLIKKIEIPVTDFTIPFEDVTKDMVRSVGGKNANLGEIKNRLNLPVPEGFCISSHAFKRFMDYNELGDKINISSVGIDSLVELTRASKAAQNLVLNARVPADLEKSILDAALELKRKAGHRAGGFYASVRSSAIHEDAQFTFAGQYKTALNVAPENVVSAYVEIIASLFTSRAIFYCRSKGFHIENMVMAVGVVEMIDAKASGVVYSRDPTDEGKLGIIINGVWGLGKYVVDGIVKPHTYVVSRDIPMPILEKNQPAQPFMLICGLEEGAIDVRVPDYIRRMPCLTDEQVTTLAGYALVLEKHYGKPQDIEWALDLNDNLLILQARPLRIIAEKRSRPVPRSLPGHKILINKGQIACKGVGAGKVYFVTNDEELKSFPEGAVLVARHTSPRFVTAMNKAGAIIADVGSPIGHLAAIAREYGVPTILNTEIAMKTLKVGQEITVDAINGTIYEGRIEQLIEAGKSDNPFKDTAVFEMLRAVLQSIVPLNLICPEDEKFSPQYCETFHDITRFAHEMAMNEMFKLGEGAHRRKGGAVKLVVKLPLDVRVIDLGGGVEKASDNITVDNIACIPMKALLKGMMAIEWPGPPPVNVKGLLSVIASTTMQPNSERSLSEPSFAVISREYMNFSVRLGYHLQTIEAYAGERINDNYIRFLFKGGGASHDRRARRTRLIKEILEKIDFHVDRTGDVLDGRVTNYDRTSIEKKLGVMARLTAFTKQLDMTLFNDAVVDWYIKEFIKKHYNEKTKPDA